MPFVRPRPDGSFSSLVYRINRSLFLMSKAPLLLCPKCLDKDNKFVSQEALKAHKAVCQGVVHQPLPVPPIVPPNANIDDSEHSQSEIPLSSDDANLSSSSSYASAVAPSVRPSSPRKAKVASSSSSSMVAPNTKKPRASPPSAPSIRSPPSVFVDLSDEGDAKVAKKDEDDDDDGNKDSDDERVDSSSSAGDLTPKPKTKSRSKSIGTPKRKPRKTDTPEECTCLHKSCGRTFASKRGLEKHLARRAENKKIGR